MVSTTS